MPFLLYTQLLAVSRLMLYYTESNHYQHNESKQVRSYTDFIITDKPSWLNTAHDTGTVVSCASGNCRYDAIKWSWRNTGHGYS